MPSSFSFPGGAFQAAALTALIFPRYINNIPIFPNFICYEYADNGPVGYSYSSESNLSNLGKI